MFSVFSVVRKSLCYVCCRSLSSSCCSARAGSRIAGRPRIIRRGPARDADRRQPAQCRQRRGRGQGLPRGRGRAQLSRHDHRRRPDLAGAALPPPRPRPAHRYRPAVFFRRDGRAYLVWTSSRDFSTGGLFCAWSDDGGLTWTTPVSITPPQAPLRRQILAGLRRHRRPARRHDLRRLDPLRQRRDLGGPLHRRRGHLEPHPVSPATGPATINNDGAQPRRPARRQPARSSSSTTPAPAAGHAGPGPLHRRRARPSAPNTPLFSPSSSRRSCCPAKTGASSPTTAWPMTRCAAG